MIIRKFTRIILGAALGISVFAFAGNVPETAYAADMSDISVTSTREDVQQVVTMETSTTQSWTVQRSITYTSCIITIPKPSNSSSVNPITTPPAI